VGPFFADGTTIHSVHFAGQVTGGSGAVLRWTAKHTPSGNQILDNTSDTIKADWVNMGSSSLFPGSFTGCATNETGAPVGYTEFIGKGPF
jgi:hypothetical protein